MWEFLTNAWVHNSENKNNWAEEIRGNLLVAATVIATLSFQAGLNPPGGVWQDSNNNGHIAGTSIMASTDTNAYFNFVSFNTVALASSSCIILLMVSGFPLNSKALMAILMLAMTSTIVFIWVTYSLSVLSVSSARHMPHRKVDGIYSLFGIASYFYFTVLALVTLFYAVRYSMCLLRKVPSVVNARRGLIKCIKTRVQLCVTLPSSHSTVV